MYQAPRGTQDILPEEARYWRFVEEQARRWALRFGYGEIRTPTFEETSVFSRGVGAGTDIVEKEMYTFKDKGGDELTLRPEATAAVMRAYLEHGLHNRPQPARLYSLASIFRYDRPQAGRYREFHQFNVEAIGELDPLLDAEVVRLLWQFLAGLQLSGLSVQLNSIGCPQCRPGFLAELVRAYEQHLAAVCPDCQRRIRVNPMRMLDCKNAQCQPAIEAAPRTMDSLCSECAEHFQRVRTYLEAVEVPYQLNHRLVRGLDYYTKTVFEVWPAVAGSQASLGGGGRYDGLAEQLEGKPTPAVGFAAGLERIILNLKSQNLPVPALPGVEVFLAPLGEAARVAAFRLADDLRVRGVPSVTGAGERSLRAQLRHADTFGARWAFILGDAELATGEVTVRNLATSEQVREPRDRAVERVLEAREGRA
ncbi:MAG: histidine--tRNA ligase [Chloroflexi bacterium]|nr:histidine--tRNA ligase [Chloroflexota bacterium]